MTHAEIIGLWPNVSTLAKDTGQKYDTVVHWKHRNSIPHRLWCEVVASANKHDLPVTFKLLAETVSK